MTWKAVARVLPWGVTAAMLVMSLGAMVVWTRNIGIQEDWGMVGPWLGNEPDLLGWLWSQNNEHRLPVGRLIYLGLLKTTNDFRSGMVASQLLLAILSLLLVHALAMARGGEHRLSDVLFPLALLHLGHWENLLWGWQIQFVSSTFLCGILLAVVIYAPVPRRAGSIAAAIAMTLLPLSGANGIAIALGMTPWALLAAFRSNEERHPDRLVTSSLVTGATLAAATTAIYFVGYVRPPWSPEPASASQTYQAVQAYFAMATGVWSRPIDGPVAAAVLIVVAAGSSISLLAFLRPQGWGDARSFGLASFIACNVLLGLAIAVSRGALPGAMPSRYAIFAVMPLLAAIVALQLYAREKTALLPSLTAAAFLLLLPLNIRAGFHWRDWYVEGIGKFERDLAERRALPEIAERNTAFLLHSCDGCLLREMRRLRNAGIAPFSALPREDAATAASQSRE